MRRIVRFSLFGIILALPGCYTHSVVPVADVPVGATIRARISAPEAERLSTVLGREYRVVHGEVVGEGAGGLLLEVPAVRDDFGQQLNQRVTIPGSSILELEVRRIDRWRTAGLVAAAVAVGSYFVVSQFGDDDGSGSGGPPKGGGDQLLVPSAPWGW